MKVYFPSYYKEFKCIAERCRHSCCVGWEISVDSVTAEKYSSVGVPLGDELRSRVDEGVIRMCDDGRCPFLDSDGLCRIISSLGEGYISDICREHPRFYHKLSGRVEGGIGAVCEEACRIILSSDSYADFISVNRECDEPDASDFDASSDREWIFALLKRTDLGYRAKLDELSSRYSLPDFLSEKDRWNGALSELELLDESRAGLLAIGTSCSNEDMHPILTRFLSYLVFRHVSLAESRENLSARVGFCLLLTLIFENGVSDTKSFYERTELARIISEEIEYSEDNTAMLIFEIESII